jgi:hypothetical protein
MTTRNRWTSVAAIVVGLVIAAGCGGKQPEPAAQQAPAATAAPPAQTQPAAQATTTPAAAVPATATVGTPTASPAAAASADAMVQDHETGAQVSLVECRRTSGDSVTIKWRYRNATNAPIKLSKGGTAWREPYQLTADAFFIDPVNKKKYLVITDDQRLPLSSKHGDWQGLTLEPGQMLNAWAKLPAPPADVETITVTLPGVAPFEGVPVLK